MAIDGSMNINWTLPGRCMGYSGKSAFCNNVHIHCQAIGIDVDLEDTCNAI
jgi:hypothetical protein